MKNDEWILLVSRFLIEDNTEDYINFDPKRSSDTNIVRSVFKRLVNNYQLLPS